MQYFNRDEVPPPNLFRSEEVRDERSMLAAFMAQEGERLSQSSPPLDRFALVDDEVLVELNKLFRGKCAFCESNASINVHLFRPPEQAEPLVRSEFSHLYYVWLRTDWGNTYAICNDCAVTSRNQFPVARGTRGRLPSADELQSFANENYGLWRWSHKDSPLLLDPCGDRNFASHISFDLEGGVRGLTRKGAATIQVFQLDRERLRDARRRAFNEYLDLLQMELEKGIQPNALNFETMEYGGGWYLLMRRIIGRVSQRLDEKYKPEQRKIGKELQTVWSTPIGREALRASIEDVRRPVESRSFPRQSSREATKKVSRVEIRNFKSIAHLSMEMPAPIPSNDELASPAEAAALLVLGENAVGKSTVLEAIGLALCDPKAREQLKRPPESFVLDPDLTGSLKRPHPMRAEVSLLFEDESELRISIDEDFSEEGEQKGLPPIFAYGAFRQFGASSERKKTKNNVITLFRSDEMLANPEAWLLGLPDDEFAMVARALKQILIVEGRADVVERDQENRRCLVVTYVGNGEDEHVIRTPLSVVSSGFRSVLAMVCDVLQGLLKIMKHDRKSFEQTEPVILIDEIEAHLHPRWKMQIMAALRRVFPKATIIATTHDPLCLRGMHNGEVIVLHRAVGSADVTDDEFSVSVQTIAHLPNVENLTIEQLLTSDFFAMFSTDSPAAEMHLARLGDLLVRREAGESLSAAEEKLLSELDRQIDDALPLGSSEVHRLVSDAVSKYLQARRGLGRAKLNELKEETRASILRALESY